MEKVAIIVCAFLVSVYAGALPSGIVTCKKSNPDYNKCLQNAVSESIKALAKGNKENNLPALEPIMIPRIFIPGSGGSVDLEQTYSDLKIYGLINSKYSRVNIDIEGENCKLDLEFLAPHVELIGTLQLKGKLFFLTLGGTSPANITIVNLNIHSEHTCKKIQKGDETFLDILNTSIELTPEKLIFDVKHLVAGSDVLSANVETVLNDNNLEIFAEVKKSYEETFRTVLGSLATIFFKKVSANEIFLQ